MMEYEEWLRISGNTEQRLEYENKQLEDKLAKAQKACERAAQFLRAEGDAGTFSNHMDEQWEEITELIWMLEDASN